VESHGGEAQGVIKTRKGRIKRCLRVEGGAAPAWEFLDAEEDQQGEPRRCHPTLNRVPGKAIKTEGITVTHFRSKRIKGGV